jgi:hypothetical protein
MKKKRLQKRLQAAKERDFDYTMVALPPPLSPEMLAALEAGVEIKEGESLDPSSTAVVLYPSVEIAQRAYNGEIPLHLPPEALGRAVVFLAGADSGFHGPGSFSVVGYLENTRVAPYN